MEPIKSDEPDLTETKTGSIEAPKVKRPVSEKQQDNLKKGREALKAKKELQLKQKEEYLQKLSIKKTNDYIKSKAKLKKDFGLNPEDSEEEEPIVQIQPKKPKKKQVVYLPPESDSEEEIVYKRTAKPKAKPEPEPIAPAPVVAEKPRTRIVFC
jgi:hypothetical protein